MNNTIIKYFTLFSLILFSTILFASDTKILTYDKDIRPLMDKYCHECHGSESPTLEEFRMNREKFINLDLWPRMDRYEYLMVFVNGEDMGSLTRRLDDGENTEDHKPGSMYKYMGKTEAERAENLKVFKGWIGYWSLESPHTLEQKIESEWLESVLIGEEMEQTSLEDEVNKILSAIKAPKN